MNTPAKIIVIGAGICGLSAAIWLRRDGHEVTLIDREGPGAGASYGNAGLLAQWAIAPINSPGIIRQGIKSLADPNAPLFLQYSYLPRLLPWLLRYVAQGTDTRTQRMAAGLHNLLHDSVEQHRALTQGTAAARFVTDSDLSYAYADRAAYARDGYAWAIKRNAGYVPELIEGAAVQEAEPMLGANIGCLAVLRNQGHIANPGAYMKALAEVFQAEGGRFLVATAKDITLRDGRVAAVETDQGALPCDHAVVTAGIWSKPILRKLGIKLPLEAERGYHLHLKSPSQVPNNPIMVAGKCAFNPMEHGLRCTSAVELAHVDAPRSPKPFALIRRYLSELFPDLQYELAEEWMGHRPSTPDSLPLIGERGATGLHLGFGHQHVGLTGGPKTGRWIADMIAGRKPNGDMSYYDPARFD